MSVIPQSVTYKESGIQWLGKIPTHWEVTTIRACFEESDARCGNKQYPLLSVTQEQGIVLQENITTKKDVSNDDKSNYKIVPLGAIAYNKMRMWQGAVGLNEIEAGIVSPAYVVVIPKQRILSKFSFYLFKTPSMIEEFGRYSYGLCSDMNTLRYEDFHNISIPLPPLKEQQAIADFLDKKTRQIEEFITKKQKLITLLEEKKQTLINQCVTQGLDSSTPLKDSGVEWIRKIPTHWEVLQLKFLGKLRGGDGFPHEYQGKRNYEFPFYKVGDLQKSKDGFFMSETENTISKEIGDTIRAKPFPKNTIVWAKIGEALCLNRRRVLKYVSYIDNNMTGFVIKQNVDLRYAFYLLSSVDLTLFMNPSVVPSISEGTQALIRVPFPPLEEQRAIAEYLDTQIEKIDLAICKIKSQINLIKEYKTTLISEAVCGRVGKEGGECDMKIKM